MPSPSMKALALCAATMIAAQAAGQVRAPRTARGCVDVADARADTAVTATGRLSARIFAGPPNFTSVAKGDAAEHVYVLTLPAPICIDDGGDFADPKTRFREIQVWAKDGDRLVERLLAKSVGHRTTIVGAAMPAQTGHHHRPMLIEARSVSSR